MKPQKEYLLEILDNLLESYTTAEGSPDAQSQLRIHIQQLETYLEEEGSLWN